MKALSLSKPHLIMVVGIPGSGKSFFAHKFAETFRAPLVSRSRIAVHLDDDAAVERIARDQIDELLKTRQSVVLDGIADSRMARLDLARAAQAADYDTLIVWVQTDPETAKSRSGRKSTTTNNRRLTDDDYEAALKSFTPPTAIEKPIVISGKHTYATQAKVVLKKLSEPRANTVLNTATPDRPDQPPNRRNILIK